MRHSRQIYLLAEALASTPREDGAQRLFGAVLAVRSEVEREAMQSCFHRLCRFDFNDPVYLIALAASYLLSGRYRPAAVCFDIVHLMTPAEPGALWLGALCHLALGRRKAGCRRLAVLRVTRQNARLRRRAVAALVYLRWRMRRDFRVF